MGTNFYIRGHRYDDDPHYHIGKRSAAGLFCWDCNVTLCKGGLEMIHKGRHEWHKNCPVCGKKPQRKDSISSGSVARELGFDKSKPAPKKGVTGCASFSWAMEPKDLLEGEVPLGKCPTCEGPFEDDKVIEDEYGTLYTLDEFKAVMSECPVQFRDSIGQQFS